MGDALSLDELALAVGTALIGRGTKVATAESCTGGWLAQALTAVAGSSAWFERGFVVYSNSAKCEMLGVETTTLVCFGAVSPETAKAMAEGALRASHADVAIAITGIAGPSGGTPEKPVGTVCFALAGKTVDTKNVTHHFAGDRRAIRFQSVMTALQLLLVD